jgi:hypothetical protein
VLSECYKNVADVLETCYTGVTTVLQACSYLVVRAAPFPEKQVDFVQKDDGGRTLPGEGEESAN